MEYKYKYEMHSHTAPCSGGGDDIEAHIDTLIAKGFSGMVVTNHFIHGDTRIDKELPWEDFVAPYAEDYERGRKYAKARDFDLLFGIEEHVGFGKEVLIYGITPEVLSEHPELRGWNVRHLIEVVHDAGGVVYQAHPYRIKKYILEPGPIEELELLDGIEVYNAANTEQENAFAAALAKEKGLAVIAGSDVHSHERAGLAGIAFASRVRTSEELVKALKEESYEIYRE